MGMSQNLIIRYALLGFLLLFLLLVDCSDVNLEVKHALNNPLKADGNGTNSSNEQKGRANSSSNVTVVGQEKKIEQVESSKEVNLKDFDKSNSSKSLEGENQKISVDGSSNVELKDKAKESGTKGGGSEEGFDAKKEIVKDANGDSSSSSMVIEKEKEKSRDEECDPSNMCFDKKKNLTACLRVPGNDSPDLSLLIQNKGTKSVSVKITAPAFVQLEETKVQLQQKEDKKVKVSLGYEGMDSLIILTTEDSQCTLDFKELIPRDSRAETGYSFKLRYLNTSTKTRFIIFLALTAFMVFGCGWIYFGFSKKRSLGNSYQTVEMELPISDVSKSEPVSETNEGWDNSWDDHWDDEEAPMTPTLPSTPNLSSRGLASRRLSKEGWKD